MTWKAYSQKIIVLQQFTQWAMIHPERLREKMEEQKDTDQATWVSILRLELAAALDSF